MSLDRINKMSKMFDMLSAIDQDDPTHLIRFLAIKNEGMLFRRCPQYGCGVEDYGFGYKPEGCKKCFIHDISEIAPYLKRLYYGG